MTKNIRNFDLEELKAILSSLNEPHFRAEQIYKWLYIKGIEDFSKMTDVPEQLRNTLSRNFTPEFLKPEEIKSSKDGTKKILFRLYDNKFIESVIIPEGRRTTVCISTQIGCKYKSTSCVS
ncbi:MAG: hypothetical protein N2115_07460 [bacterium]|nr:hypothetical protein [bacterium]